MPGMLLVGAAGSKVGKTDFVCRLLRKYAPGRDIVGVKATTIREHEGPCPRGLEGCGVCTSLTGEFEILEEGPTAPPEKDTGRLLAAGARRVLWLRSHERHLPAAAAALARLIGPDVTVVCESCSLRRVVLPDLFLMLMAQNRPAKPSAMKVAHHVDRFVHPEPRELERTFHEIDLANGRWRIREPATLIVLAGGESSRMGSDKSFLEVGGKWMIQHIIDALAPHFEQVLISATEPGSYRSLEAVVVPDRVPGLGPLGGLLTALETSRHDLNLAVACDIPNADPALVERLLWAADGVDAVVPKLGGETEPLFTVYRRSMIPAARELLAGGDRRTRSLFERGRVSYFELDEAERLLNLNTKAEYEAYRAATDKPSR
jgi:molybdopterin-guanine dinucleotide biosynthesis protein A